MDVTGLKCADLGDAMGRLHRHRCHILDLVSPTPGRILFGPAVTISYFPSCSAGLDPERYNLANLFYEAVGDDPAGKVVVPPNSEPQGPEMRWRGGWKRRTFGGAQLTSGGHYSVSRRMSHKGRSREGPLRTLRSLLGDWPPVFCPGSGAPTRRPGRSGGSSLAGRSSCVSEAGPRTRSPWRSSETSWSDRKSTTSQAPRAPNRGGPRSTRTTLRGARSRPAGGEDTRRRSVPSSALAPQAPAARRASPVAPVRYVRRLCAHACPQGRGAQVTLAGAQTRPRERPRQAFLVLAPVRPLRELPPRPPEHSRRLLQRLAPWGVCSHRPKEE